MYCIQVEESNKNKGEVILLNIAIKIAISAIMIAQSLKIPIKYIRTGNWDLGMFFETGGMPSSHSAGVSSLATFIAMRRGISTIDFALSTIFGLIVMYDAQGVRRQTGELSLAVNEIHEEVERLQDKPDRHEYDTNEKRIRERLGHQPEEVVGGALLGVLIGAAGHALSKKK